MKKLTVLIILCILVGCVNPEMPNTLEHPTPEKENKTALNETKITVSENVSNNKTLTIATWNLQIFGQSKASKSWLMEVYADTIDEYDVIVIQEIRDKTGTAFVSLCNRLTNYSCINSSRAGRSTSKEQYGVLYRNGINIIEVKDYNPDPEDRWERPPYFVTFNVSGYVFSLYTIHTKPDDVPQEMEYLDALVNVSKNQSNVVVLGDLNADCSYYSNDDEENLDTWFWLINDTEDTTVSQTDCAYDRILLDDDMHEEYSREGVFTEGINKTVSDHYVVWVELIPFEKQ